MKSYYDKGYSKGLTLGRTVRYYNDEVLGNIAHKMSDFDNHEQSMTEIMRGLRHGIDEQEERRKHKMPMASARNPSSEGRIVRRVVTVSNPSNPSKLRPWMEGDVLGTLKYGRFLYHMGNYVYVAYLNTDSEPPVIQGKRLSEFEYTNLLDWNRANVYNMHGTNVITVPWAGGTREFTYRGDETFPVIETGPETQAPKEKKVKGIERYKGYYINSFGRGKWWAALESSAVASEKAAKDEADYGPRSSLPELKALIDSVQNPSSFSGNVLKLVTDDVKRHDSSIKLNDAWVHKSGNQWEFHFRQFYWNGRADNAKDAKEKGWSAWLRKEGVEGYAISDY